MWTTASLSEQTVAPGAQSAFDVLGGFTLTEKHNISGIIAVHGIFNYLGLTNTVETYGAFGLTIAEDDALAIPQVPEPFTDGDASWLVHHYFEWEDVSQITKSIVINGRSRRRIPIKQSVAFVVDNAAGSDASLQYGVYLRMLLQRAR